MNSLEINKQLRNEPDFFGVYARDRLPRKTPRPSGLVINTDRSTEPGSHWIAYFIDAVGHAEIFDPLASEIPKNEILDFVKRNNSGLGTAANVVPFQSDTSSKCGQFCVFYLKNRLNGRSLCEIHALLSRSAAVNDAIV